MIFAAREAQSLCNSLAVAGEALKEARVGHQDAIEAFVDANWSNDGVFALRREGLAYAQPVRQYSSAVMAWLVFVDKQLYVMDTKC